MKSTVQKYTRQYPGYTRVFGLLFSLLFVNLSIADELTNITDIKGCRAVKDADERLLCYDTVSEGGIFNEQQVKEMQVEKFGSSKMAKPPAPAAAPAPAATPSTPAQASTPPPSTKSSADKLAVTIVRSRKDGNGFYYFQTSDGQVWKQQNATRWSMPVPFQAHIKAGMFGSFFLVADHSVSTRVKRVR